MTRHVYIILILFLVNTGNLISQNIQVCPTCTFKNIDDGIEASFAGDTISVLPGEYVVDNIIVRKKVALIGVGNPILVSRSGDEILTILADSVTVTGFTFKNVTTSYLKERSAIRVKKHDHFHIESNIIKDCFFGIYLENAENGVVCDNTILGNATNEADSGNGIHAWYCDDITILNNEIRGQRDGIYFEFVNNSTIQYNHSEENKRYGLHFMFSNDDTYTDNVFVNNGVGVAVMFSRRIVMERNEFSFNRGRSAYGLLLKEIYDGNIISNHFNQNTVGIFVEGSNRINYHLNSFERNGWAIKFSGGCEDNTISYNNFLENALDLVVNTKLSSNQFHHNYWSNYSGYDLDKDAVGDVPHFPVKLFSYVLDKAPEAIVLLRSLFVDLINFSEKVSPVFTPKEVKDDFPLMKQVK